MHTPSHRNLSALGIIAVFVLGVACTSDSEPAASPTATSVDATTVPAEPSPAATARPPLILDTPSPTVPAPSNLARSRAVVDEVIEAVEAKDVDALESLMRYQHVPCDGEKAFSGPPYPDCDGSELGTLVPAAAIGVCDTVWHRDPRPLVERFVDRAGALFAVLEGPGLAFEYAGEVPAEARPWDYRVIFRSTATGEERGAVAVVEADAVGLLVLGCGEPGWELRHREDIPMTVVVAGEGFAEPTPFPTQAPTESGAVDAPRGSRTGIDHVDQILDAIDRGDAAAVEAQLRARSQLCTFAPGIGSVRCPDDGLEGDIVEVFPSGGGCHGSLIEWPDLTTIAAAMTSADVELYAVGRHWGETGRFTALYTPTDHSEGGFTVTVSDGAIVGQGDYACSTTPAERAGWMDVILRGPAWPEDAPAAE